MQINGWGREGRLARFAEADGEYLGREARDVQQCEPSGSVELCEFCKFNGLRNLIDYATS